MCVEWAEMNEGVFIKPTSLVISNSAQNACLAPSSARSLLREFKRSQTHFQATNASKTLAAGLRPDPLGELKRSPDPLAAVEEDNYNLSPLFGAHCGEGGMDVRGMGRNE